MGQLRSGRKTQDGLQQKLVEKDLSVEQQQRICGSGVNIGAQSTSEIALSIMAPVIEKRYSSLCH